MKRNYLSLPSHSLGDNAGFRRPGQQKVVPQGAHEDVVLLVDQGHMGADPLGRHLGQRRAAEVEVVIDNSEGRAATELSEIAVQRTLDRSGDGVYRLNGARCRLVDVLELLSDTGLGKEAHSVVSQGRVEAIVTSKPRDRRLLIEEAAGLGKHRKRRRRAQLKLARTQDNLDRALDVEREARSRLRPLKRQAEAAELHARLERQSLEARWELGRDALRASGIELEQAEAAARAARERSAEAEQALAAVARRREAAEEALAQRSEQREALSDRAYRARAAGERVGMRLEAARATAGSASSSSPTIRTTPTWSGTISRCCGWGGAISARPATRSPSGSSRSAWPEAPNSPC